jgi:hypothetical protein
MNLVADEQAGQIRRRGGVRQLAEQSPGAYAEQMVQHPAGIGRTAHPVRKRNPVRDAVLHHASQDAVRLEHRESLAVHVRREMHDLPVFDLDPLAVRARQTDRLPARAELIEDAQDLGFLAANHIRNAGVVATSQSRRNPDFAALPRDLAHSCGDFIQAGGACRIRHLEPSLAAADHAAHDDRRLARSDPVAGLLLQRGGEFSTLDGKNARRRRTHIDDPAGRVETVCAEGSGAPVDREHEVEMQVKG